MTTTKRVTDVVTKLVAEAIALDREIAEMENRLVNIKLKLIGVAGSDLMDKTDTDGGGWSVELCDEEGNIARVTQPGEKLKASLDSESKVWQKLAEIPGVKTLFNVKIKYSPMENFRESLATDWPSATQKKILKLVTSESAPTVSFETKDKA